MIGHVCGIGHPELPDAGGGMCCIGAAMFGPERCTCWVPVFDLEQAPVRRRRPVERSEPCGDCAYHSTSPERQGDETVQGDEDDLRNLIVSGSPFFCHQGIRRPVRWEHRPQDCTPADCDEIVPDRVSSIPGSPSNYQPPIRWGAPYKADGICGGWAARRRLYLAEGVVL